MPVPLLIFHVDRRVCARRVLEVAFSFSAAPGGPLAWH